jgi:hypothetical protein
MGLLICDCDRGFHQPGETCSNRDGSLLKGIGWALLLALPLWGLIYAVLKLAGVL